MKNRNIRDLQPISSSSPKKRWKIDLELENCLNRALENQVRRSLLKNQNKVKTDQSFEWQTMWSAKQMNWSTLTILKESFDKAMMGNQHLSLKDEIELKKSHRNSRSWFEKPLNLKEEMKRKFQNLCHFN